MKERVRERENNYSLIQDAINLSWGREEKV
jgi:hypothetical protein